MEEITDLRPGMMLEGTVTNVAAFGAFVDTVRAQNATNLVPYCHQRASVEGDASRLGRMRALKPPASLCCARNSMPPPPLSPLGDMALSGVLVKSV